MRSRGVWHRIGFAIGLVAMAGAGPTEPRTFEADFRGKPFNVAELGLVGGHAAELVRSEPQGLRITMPAGMGNPESVGIAPRFRLRGDFDLAASFEILKADKPTEGYGLGAQLWLETDTPTKEAVTAEWSYAPEKGGRAAVRVDTRCGQGGRRTVVSSPEDRDPGAKGNASIGA